MISRKKIRGYNRKLKQLTAWKEHLLNNKFTKSSKSIFHLHLAPFYWYKAVSPPIKFTSHIIKMLSEVSYSLKENKSLKELELHSQVWIYFPRTILSNVIVAPLETIKDREMRSGANETTDTPPTVIKMAFLNNKWKQTKDVSFSSEDPSSNDPNWITHLQGTIWIPLL